MCQEEFPVFEESNIINQEIFDILINVNSVRDEHFQ